MNKLNTLAFFAGYEIITDLNGQIYLIKDDHTSVAAESVRGAVLMVPMSYRKGLMDQWLIRNDNVVEPLYRQTANENEQAHKEFEGPKDLRGPLEI